MQDTSFVNGRRYSIEMGVGNSAPREGKESSSKRSESAVENDNIIHLSEKDLEYRIAFDIFDADGNGTISEKEYISVLRSINVPDIKQALEADFGPNYDGKGKTCTQFADLIRKRLDKPPITYQMEQAFQVFSRKHVTTTRRSKDVKPQLDADELRYVLENLGDPLEPDELDKFIEDLKFLESGYVDVKATVEMMTS